MKILNMTVGTLCVTCTILMIGCAKQEFNPKAEIGLVSREDGSGTRSAFTELTGVQRKDASGKKIDHTSSDTVVAGSTAVTLSTVADDPTALGYISLGATNSSIKVINVDGIAPTPKNISSGAYKLVHPFNVVTRGNVNALSPVAADFLAYILSADGQHIVEKAGYLRVTPNAIPYKGKSDISGKVICSGSSSVTPCMEKLKEAYLRTHGNVSIEVQQSDSSTGIADVRDAVCDFGMASRALKESEATKGLVATAIALDGLAVIVCPINPITSLSRDQIRRAFEGEIRTWEELLK